MKVHTHKFWLKNMITRNLKKNIKTLRRTCMQIKQWALRRDGVVTFDWCSRIWHRWERTHIPPRGTQDWARCPLPCRTFCSPASPCMHASTQAEIRHLLHHPVLFFVCVCVGIYYRHYPVGVPGQQPNHALQFPPEWSKGRADQPQWILEWDKNLMELAVPGRAPVSEAPRPIP